MEIRRGMYGLPQAGILANKLLRKRLGRYGYFEVHRTVEAHLTSRVVQSVR
jgi:hypothetical protein